MERSNADRSDDTVCGEVMAQHSDYMDGLLVPHEAARVQWHLASCSQCARYDRIVRQSLELVRELPQITPSEDFDERLQHRIFHVQDGAALAEPRATAGAAATLAVASMIALLAWTPVFFADGDDGVTTAALELPQPRQTPASPASPVTPLPQLPVLAGGAGDAWLPLPATSLLGGGDVMAILASFHGPYSPLVVNPPVHRSVRTVSSEYSPVD